MTWDAVAAAHLGCRAVLKSVRELRCIDHDVTLVVPKDPNGATPTPPRWQRDRTDLSPMPAGFRERFAAERSALRRVRQDTTTPEENPNG